MTIFVLFFLWLWIYMIKFFFSLIFFRKKNCYQKKSEDVTLRTQIRSFLTTKSITILTFYYTSVPWQFSKTYLFIFFDHAFTRYFLPTRNNLKQRTELELYSLAWHTQSLFIRRQLGKVLLCHVLWRSLCDIWIRRAKV